MIEYRKALRRVRLYQILFVLSIFAGIVTAVAGAAVVGLAISVVGLLGFFVLVAIVGWVKADK